MTQQNGASEPGGGFKQGYDIAGDGLRIIYKKTNTSGVTTESLKYLGPDGDYTLTSNDYHFQTSDPGKELSMTLPVNQATGEVIKLIVLLPDVYRAHGNGIVPIQTLAIRTSNLDPTHAPDLKQVQSYQVYRVDGLLTSDSFARRKLIAQGNGSTTTASDTKVTGGATYTWDSTTVSNGNHTIAFVATDSDPGTPHQSTAVRKVVVQTERLPQAAPLH